MKKHKLVFKRQTVRLLSKESLAAAAGGHWERPTKSCIATSCCPFPPSLFSSCNNTDCCLEVP